MRHTDYIHNGLQRTESILIAVCIERQLCACAGSMADTGQAIQSLVNTCHAMGDDSDDQFMVSWSASQRML